MSHDSKLGAIFESIWLEEAGLLDRYGASVAEEVEDWVGETVVRYCAIDISD